MKGAYDYEHVQPLLRCDSTFPFAERKTVQEAKTSDSISEHIEKLSKLECAIEKNAISAMRFYG